LTFHPAPGVALALTPVESSHIAAIGYLEAERVLLVRYKDGSLYAWDGILQPAWAFLAAATSKGTCLHAVIQNRKGILITKGGNAEDSQSTRAAAPLAVETTIVPLNILISKGVMPTDVPANGPTLPVAEPGGNEVPSPGPLNVIDEDADKCCRKTLTWMFDRDIDQRCAAVCSDCGTTFHPNMVGSVCHWRIVPSVAIVRPRR
jgi:hypothetical protein